MKKRILLLEDDLSLIDGLQYTLRKNDFHTEIARTVKEARQWLDKEPFDLLLLDVTLPDGTGFQVCEEVRAGGSLVPIIFLTAADEEVHIIRGLDSGGDDYITKPFKVGELCSRIRALLRRAGQDRTDAVGHLVSGGVQINLLKNEVTVDGKLVEVTGGEYKLLCLLLQNKDQVLTRQIILEKLWDEKGNFVDDNTLSVYVRRLREKVEADPSQPRYLQTVRGFGYQWKEVKR